MAIIQSYNDARIRTFHSGKRSIIKNFENSLNKAKGDVVFLADQDDIWFPDKVQTVLSYMSAYDLVFSNAAVFSEHTNDSYLLYESKGTKTGLVRNFIKNNYIGATMAFRREVLTNAMPFPADIYMHDVWLALVAEIKGKTFFIEQPLIYYRRHGNNASETGSKSSNSVLKKIQMRYNLGISLLRRFV